jgi:hypothetical protein
MGYMCDDTGEMIGTMIAIMGLCVVIGLVIGLSLLTGWQFIRAIEKRS